MGKNKNGPYACQVAGAWDRGAAKRSGAAGMRSTLLESGGAGAWGCGTAVGRAVARSAAKCILGSTCRVVV